MREGLSWEMILVKKERKKERKKGRKKERKKERKSLSDRQTRGAGGGNSCVFGLV